jgi:hypothetical protein
MGPSGALWLGVLLCFRLLLVLPYGFLLGSWAVERSLAFDASAPGIREGEILLLTLLVLAAAAVLECTVAHWLGGIYYLKFGV